MSLSTPTVAAISAQILAQLESALSTVIPLLPKAFLRVLSNTLGAIFVLEWKYGGFIFQQIFVKTATIKEVSINGVLVSPLKEWGRLISVGDPDPAVQAELDILITVTSQIGQLDAGTQLINVDNGVTYLLVAAVPLDAPTKTGQIRAAADQGGGNGAGTIGDLEVNDIVSFANPIANVFRDAVVTVVTTAGEDAEDTEIYRQRIIDRFQKRPQGGALIDYEVWGLDAEGVLRIYPYTGNQPGRVDVFVESSTEVDGIPTAGQLQAVFDAIFSDPALAPTLLANRRPGNAFVNVFPITRRDFDVQVSGITGIDAAEQATVTADIEAALVSFFAAREPFISGVTTVPRTETITKASVTSTVDDIVTGAGGSIQGAVEFDFNPFVTGRDVYTLVTGEKAKTSAANISVGYS